MGEIFNYFKSVNLDELLAYDTIKVVKIRDRKLGILHNLLQLGIFLYIIVYTIVIQQRYLNTEIPYGNIRATVQEPKIWKSASELPYCKQNQPLYNNRSNNDCVYMLGLDITYPAAMMNSILISTRIKDTTYPVGNANCMSVLFTTKDECAPYKNVSTSKRYYTTDIESYTIYIEHAIYSRQIKLSATNPQLKGRLEYNDGSKRSVPFDTKREGDIFTIQTLLDAADKPSLDVASGLEGGGSLRYDGVLILCIVEYSNEPLHPKHLSYKYTLYHIPGVNVIGMQPSEAVPGGISQRSWYGIRVIFVISGKIGEFDFPTLLTSLVNGLVLVKVATTIVDILLLYIMPNKNNYRKHKFEVTEGFELKSPSTTKVQIAPQTPVSDTPAPAW